MAFESLTDRLAGVFKKLRGHGKLSEADIKAAMREVRMALLEADVNYKVAKDFCAKVSERAMGQEVMESLTPAQQVVKIVNEELVALMGGEEAPRLVIKNKGQTIIMLCGLQGNGKTTHAAKLAKYYIKQGRRPMLVACDIYRPAAIDQLQVVGRQAGAPVFTLPGEKPPAIAKKALAHAKDYGNDIIILDTAGRLQIDEVHPEYYLQPHEPTKGRKYPPIQKVLKPGQEVLVQVVKEPNGSKGAFLTTWLSLAGRFLVLTPGQEQIGISRKVEDGEERNRLRELIRGLEPGEGLGAIVRTVSAGTSKTTLQKDLSFLKRVWKDIRKRATTEKVPSLIYQEPGLASRSVRDYLSDDVSEVWVDNAETAEAIREMASLLFPRKGDLVHLYEKHDKTLWEHFGLLNQIEQVHSREVLMPSGGRLVFDQTEALMAIDINSGKIGGKTNFEAMAFRTNMEAATAIARQLRLRDIGGQIVIDFIEMRDPEHCREVEKELRNAMKGDRARHDIGKMSSFGLLQIVRQRTGSSAISISMETCPHCKGTGQRRNMEWQSVQTLRDLHRAMRSAAAAGQTEYAHSVDAELGLYLLNHKRERLSLMEKEFHIRLDIRIEGISSAPAAPAQQQGHQHNGQNNGR